MNRGHVEAAVKRRHAGERSEGGHIVVAVSVVIVVTAVTVVNVLIVANVVTAKTTVVSTATGQNFGKCVSDGDTIQNSKQHRDSLPRPIISLSR